MRLRARQADAPAALGIQIDGIDGKPVPERKREGSSVASRGLKHDLQIRTRKALAAANECVGLEDIAGERAAAIDRVLQQVPRASRQRAQRDAVALRVAGLHEHAHGEVIVEVSADTRQMVRDLDPVLAQLFAVTHSGQHQYLR